MDIRVNISNRHVHLTNKDLDILFGNNYKLTIKKPLHQGGQYACMETVSLKTDKSLIEDVRIIGPTRKYTQVEISKTDSYKLGIEPPYRDSGDLRNASMITIIGPKGKIAGNYVIMANRHIHITGKEDRLLDGSIVRVAVKGEKGGILDNVVVKQDDSYYYELHLDMDDANSHNLHNDDVVEIIMGDE